MTAPLPVLYVLDSHRFGGAEMSWLELVSHLDRARVAPSFICPAHPALDTLVERARAAGIPCAGREEIVRTYDIAGRRRFAARVAALAPGAIVHFNQNTLDACRHQIPIARRIAARRAGTIGLVSTVRDLCRRERAGALRAWRRRRAFRALDHVACNSSAIATQVARYRRPVTPAPAVIHTFLPPDRVARAAALCADVERQAARARLGLAPGARVVASVSVSAGRKGQADLIEHLPRALARAADLVLLLVGADEEGAGVRLEARARALGCERAVRRLGWQADVLAVLAACDALVHAAAAEAFGRTILEAMVMGLPVVAYRSGGTVDQVVDGETGILVAPGDAAALLERLGDLLAAPERARAMGERGRMRALDLFRPERTVAAYHALYDEVAAAKRGAGGGP